MLSTRSAIFLPESCIAFHLNVVFESSVGPAILPASPLPGGLVFSAETSQPGSRLAETGFAGEAAGRSVGGRDQPVRAAVTVLLFLPDVHNHSATRHRPASDE